MFIRNCQVIYHSPLPATQCDWSWRHTQHVTMLPDSLPVSEHVNEGTSSFIKHFHRWAALIARKFFSNFRPLVFKPTHVMLTSAISFQRLDHSYQVSHHLFYIFYTEQLQFQLFPLLVFFF